MKPLRADAWSLEGGGLDEQRNTNAVGTVAGGTLARSS
tara:strand:+ start:249 stop:362 length:114 start_codon:yes stop_codon:yes gene_type:complete